MRQSSTRRQQQRSWAEILCFGCTCLQLFWGRVVMRKWLNIPTKESDYSADTESDSGSDVSDDEFCDWPRRESRFKDDRGGQVQLDANDALPTLRRRKSETFRAQYINKKEIKICAGTWNVAGRVPPDDLDLDGWLDLNEPADIYVIGFQEIIPLNAGNIFGAEDSRPVSKWEDIIRQSLSKIQAKTKFKCFSDPPTPSRFKPAEDAPDIEDEIILESDSDGEEEIYPVNDETSGFDGHMVGPVNEENEAMNADVSFYSHKNDFSAIDQDLETQFSSPKKLDRLKCFRTEDSEETEEPNKQFDRKLLRTLSGTEKIGFCWPEAPLDLLSQHLLERPNSFKSMKSFKASKSYRKYSSLKSGMNIQNRKQSDAALLAELDLEFLIKRKRRPAFVRIVSKQMVGVFFSIWVRRNLRKHIHNISVSTVGVGAMGYIGNKGSISVSMSVYQTLFCFVCSHLTSGEKEADLVKRNADVYEIHRRTHFNSHSVMGLPKSIYDHERIIWLGDLNYRINLSYETTRQLLLKKNWSNLRESDQLIKELRKGRAFDGWSEGILTFAPTYKYEINSEKYIGDDPKGRRTPAWCDRVLSFGKGMRLISYRRNEIKFSDHRPVTASYMVEVEVFSPKKLQRALTFTDAEIEEEPIISDMSVDRGMSRLMWERISLTGVDENKAQ
ncbi:type IV inositol polyphosphate 5-phosphatase 3 isoform X1 [Coffea eugenioides]|uniref:Type IV inositol polyphosphate 5-phosphatase 3 isoform X1 n=1 Tax=Coffea arabica TaxID=13443 RepID=A0A6P6URL5_COFAR|nr:type IV inositol polyphosphate 5-phosphatase 3-like isoform X1 [Coffea arabica]XP_027092321.1 type IV inositol polyphosphate 5-phosphatase 3-like isoform X1 [Coffea arabica]XP_027092322.1 type IV inositol polyphosphate 5-phosphatase 3-like isoform X1 [Coffea arabica]XP_027092323.1 type IV inositol polyphosphate 5-phosphatase 3-like isoform X1 [Coffea arabica]XP_027147846.1 type IV inositol polyphosphate 5-phosphatase 3 isoform X1 [Coffea eugenioides]XP_027147847.1 type IV inositol polyphosp